MDEPEKKEGDGKAGTGTADTTGQKKDETGSGQTGTGGNQQVAEDKTKAKKWGELYKEVQDCVITKAYIAKMKLM